jgi:4-hydroxythreonine-4-phosphate dehydrogenase
LKNKFILITSGEPAGIGPEICLDIIKLYPYDNYIPIVVIDIDIIKTKAKILNKHINFKIYDNFDSILLDYSQNNLYISSNDLIILNIKCSDITKINNLDVKNVPYVLNMLDIAISISKNYPNIGIVTAPVHKGIINHSGIKFSGHTEYLANAFNINQVVMLLANDYLKIALATTHLALKDVSSNISIESLKVIINIIINDFKLYFNINNPKIAVCGLNPHCGENGVLGSEELDIINPVIEYFQQKNNNVTGPYSADTIFNQYKQFNVILAMYHDQGLPVIKFSDFFGAINITLGLPILRTSVDHGTAIDLTNKGIANSNSLLNAIKFHTKIFN